MPGINSNGYFVSEITIVKCVLSRKHDIVRYISTKNCYHNETN